MIESTNTLRGTKVVATVGPASESKIPELVDAGVDVFRLNFSHGTVEEHGRRANAIRQAAATRQRFVAILADLQGPKIRTGKYRDGQAAVPLEPGASITIDTALATDEGTADTIATTYPALADELDEGSTLVIGDGVPVLEVRRISGTRIECRVMIGGEIGESKGINLRGGGLSAPALTKKDLTDLVAACNLGVDYLAISFVRSADDIRAARSLVAENGGSCGIIAKLERAEAVNSPEVLDSIIEASDAVMVARGDLGIEIGDAALVGRQKQIIRRARALGKSVITATQMMESMITSPHPTRAEVMDVANAVLDGTDAVMLSGETAVGLYPVATVEAMVKVIRGAEASNEEREGQLPKGNWKAIDESVAFSAMLVAEHLEGVRAVACLTSSGNTPRLMSRRRSRLPIYALADNPQTLAKLALIRGVHPRLFESGQIDYDLINEASVQYLIEDGAIRSGDRVIISKGDYRNVQGGTNTLKIMEIT